MERYFYFGESDVDTTGEACMFPLSSFLGMTPSSGTRTTLHFKSRNGAATDDVVQFGHAALTPKQFMTQMAGFMKGNQRNPYLIVGDGESGIFATGFSETVTVNSVTTEA